MKPTPAKHKGRVLRDLTSVELRADGLEVLAETLQRSECRISKTKLRGEVLVIQCTSVADRRTLDMHRTMVVEAIGGALNPDRAMIGFTLTQMPPGNGR
jgi:hypothetical protein